MAPASSQGPKQITSKSGNRNLVTIENNGSVNLHPTAILRETPIKDIEKFTIQLAKQRFPKGSKTEETRNVMRDMGLQFTDGSVTSIVGIRGCVLSYNHTRLESATNMASSKNSDFETQFGVNIVSVGIPVERYDQLSAILKRDQQVSLSKDLEACQGDYVWIDASVAGFNKNQRYNVNDDAFFDKASRQVFYVVPRPGKAAGVEVQALGPFHDSLCMIQSSAKGVFFGNLRLKANVAPGDKKCRYKLGMTIHHLQIEDLCHFSAPDIVSRASAGLYLPDAIPSATMMDFLAGLDKKGREEHEEDEDEEEDEEEGEGEEETEEVVEEVEEEEEEEEIIEEIVDETAQNGARDGATGAGNK